MNVMLDLETMGTSSTSAIIAIGAVKFSMQDGIIDKFYRSVDLQSCIDLGLTIDGDTLMWWMQQSEEARSQFRLKGNPLYNVLNEFSLWLGNSDYKIWGNGAAFDNAILANAYKACKLPQPWKFWNDRCYRTVKSINSHVPFKRVGTYHNALDDAESQALHLIDISKSNYGI